VHRPAIRRLLVPTILIVAMAWAAHGFLAELWRARGLRAGSKRPGAPALLWRFESPEVRRLGLLLEDAAAKVGDAGPVVFEVRNGERSQEQFVFRWAQFLRPDLELVMWRDLHRRPIGPSHWLVFGARSKAPAPARRRFQLRHGVLFVLR
jgi:hypothetical protein